MCVCVCCRSQPLPARQQQPQQEPGEPGSGAGLSQGGVVPGSGDRRAHRRRSHPGAAHHAGLADATQREQTATGPEAADAVAPPLQLPRTPHQKGPRGQAGPGVHGSGDRPRELLPHLRQDETSGPGQRKDPIPGALGDVQWPWQAGIRMIPAGEQKRVGPLSSTPPPQPGRPLHHRLRKTFPSFHDWTSGAWLGPFSFCLFFFFFC